MYPCEMCLSSNRGGERRIQGTITWRARRQTEAGPAIQTNPAFILAVVDEWGESKVEIGYPSCMGTPSAPGMKAGQPLSEPTCGQPCSGAIRINMTTAWKCDVQVYKYFAVQVPTLGKCLEPEKVRTWPCWFGPGMDHELVGCMSVHTYYHMRK